MNSGGHRFFTVVTIITMIFGPVFLHHHWVYELTSITSDTHTVQCVVHEPCPKQKVIVNVVRPPLPARARTTRRARRATMPRLRRI